MANLREAFEYAAKNPNSQTARDLEAMATSGALDVEAKKFGIDLTPFKPVQEVEKPKKDLLQKTTDVVTSIFPGKQVGESIGTAVASGIQALKGNKQGALDIAETAPTPLQVVGDVAQGALSVAGVKAPVAGSAVGRIAQTAALGAGIGGTGAIAEGETIKDVAKQTATGAVTGTVFQGLAEIAPKLGTVLGNKAKNLRVSNLKLSPQDKLRFNEKVDDVVGFLKNQNIKGSPVKQYTQVVEKYDLAENILQDTIKQTGKTYTRKELVDDAMRIPEKYAGQLENPEVYDQLIKKSERLADYIKNSLGTKYGDKIPAEAINKLKRSYMKNGFNKAGDAVSNEASLTIGDELYKKILVDIPEVETFNKQYATIINARKILGKALGRNQLGYFGNIIALGVGGGAGGALGGVPGAIVGSMLGRPVAEKVAGTAAKTQYAKVAEKVGKTLSKTKGSKVPKAITAIVNQ